MQFDVPSRHISFPTGCTVNHGFTATFIKRLFCGFVLGTVNMNSKGLVGHKARGDSRILTLRGYRISGFENF